MADKFMAMKELVVRLNEARRTYEQENREIMSNLEYDRLYDELALMEKDLGIVLSNSPTCNVGYEVQSELPKEAHAGVMLSLDKTKDVEALKQWLGAQEGVLSWKLDGLTIVLSYENGKLIKAVTRGNGQIGEVITPNARVFENLPVTISDENNLVVRGEAVIRYSDFEKINAKIPDETAKYKNPRNLCSGTVRQLNNEITAQRKVHFYAFSLVSENSLGTRLEQMSFLKDLGFDVVDHRLVKSDNLEEEVKSFQSKVGKSDLPSDGLVLGFNDVAYGYSLGSTSKFPRDSIAFKWEDEIATTTLTGMEWSPSRTGLINPIALFEPVELEGTTVTRASVHNISILEELQLDIGDEIGVYKANMIIPQISENFSAEKWESISNENKTLVKIPQECPVCGEKTRLNDDGVKTLVCPNPGCLAKQLKSFVHLVGRDALNIEGLSEATLEKFIGLGLVKELADLYRLKEHEDQIIAIEGLGKKSFNNLITSIEKSRKTTMDRALYGLGIPNIGTANAKNICKELNYDWEKICSVSEEELKGIFGIGEKMAEAYVNFFKDETNRPMVKNLVDELNFINVKQSEEVQSLADKIFVITGSLENFSNRKELQEYIEARGGKVTGSVTAKTNFLINNDTTSNSSKNKKAKELDIKILSEEDLLALS